MKEYNAMANDFDHIYESPKEIAIKWKKNGGKVVGFFCGYFPEEILHAAGILPFRIVTSNEADDVGGHLPKNICSFARSAFDLRLEGIFGFLDGVVASQTSYAPQDKYYPILSVPNLVTDNSMDYFEKEIEILIHSIEKQLIGGSISENAIANSIKIYNHSRSLFQELDKARQQGSLDASILYEAILGARGMMKEESTPLLEALVSDARPTTGEESSKIKVHVSGGLLTDIELIRMLERSGIQVVSDDLCTGTKYFENLVDETKPPVVALAERYLKKIPCNYMCPENFRVDYICRNARNSKADGVVILQEKFCDPFLFDAANVEKQLQETGMPVLFLRVDKANESPEQIETQIQSFKKEITG
jgi:benzoyl-CoA reductase subunit C